MKNILLLAALALIAIGGGLVYGGNFTKNYISEQLTAQKITFGTAEELTKGGRPDLVKYAGQTVNTGPEAKAFASYIEGHLKKVAGGLTYSEVSALYQKDKTNKTLEAQRQSLFMGEMLRGTLLNVWGWSVVGMIAVFSAIGLWVVAIALLVTYLVLNRPVSVKSVAANKTVAKKTAKKAGRK